MKKIKEIAKRIAAAGIAAMLLISQADVSALADELTEVPKEEPQGLTVFEQSAAIDGIKITVSADEGVFPEGAVLSVEKVTKEQERKAEKAVEEERPDDRQVAVSYTYDIKILDKEGNEIQPADESRVKLSFNLEEVADSNLETNIYHIRETDPDGTASGEKAGDDRNYSEETTESNDTASSSEESDNKELIAEKLEVETEGDTATAETDGFSLYTVEFSYNDLQYVMPGDSEVALSEILNKVSLTGEVTNVEVSSPELFSAGKNDSGEWIVTARRAFSSEEWMKITINDKEYKITVTDDSVIMSFADLQTLINNAEDGGTVILEKDVNWKNSIPGLEAGDSGPLVIPKGRTVTLDLNGHTINRGLVSSTEQSGGNVITVNGTLTLTDGSADGTGKLTGGNTIGDGGGVFIDENATFTMEGGSITNCTANSGGGGVRVNGGTFTMNGGTISSCTATHSLGGGVKVSNGTFNMTGGTISGCTGRGVFVDSGATFTMSGSARIDGCTNVSGGGVYVNGGTFTMEGSARITGCTATNDADDAQGGGGLYVFAGTFNVSGSPVISGNKKGDKTNNVALNDNKTITVTGALTTGAEIRVNASNGSKVAVPGKPSGSSAAYTITAADVEKFHSDDTSLSPGLDGGNVVLKATLPTATLSNPSMVYNGSAFSPTISFGGETLTKDSDYTLSYKKVVDTEETALAGAPKDVGSYKLVVAGKGTYAGKQELPFTITKKPVTVSGITVKDKIYDGGTTAELITTNASFGGICDGDTLTVSDAGAGTFADKDAGESKAVDIDATKFVLGGVSAGNYVLAGSGQQSTADAKIKRRPVTITAEDQDMAEGGSIVSDMSCVEITPGEGLTTALVSGHALSSINLTHALDASHNNMTGTITAAHASIVGADNTDVSGNYDITYVNGTCKVIPTAVDPMDVTKTDTTLTIAANKTRDFQKYIVVRKGTRPLPDLMNSAWKAGTGSNGGGLVFTGLTRATEYDIYTCTEYGMVSPVTTVKTDKSDQTLEASVLPEQTEPGYAVTVALPAGDNSSMYEYVLTEGADNTLPANSVWRPLPAIKNGQFLPEGLSRNTTYKIWLRRKEDVNHKTSAAISKTFTTPAEVMLSYDANGGSGNPPETKLYVPNSQVVVRFFTGISKYGYTFKEWNARADGLGEGYYIAEGSGPSKDILTITAPTVLYAKWTPNSYKVIFDANCEDAGGSMIAQDFVFDTAQQLTGNGFTRTNYIFAGWALKPDGEVVYKDHQSVKNLAPSGEVTLYAVWFESGYSISGIVKQAGSPSATPVDGVKVKLVRGKEQYGEEKTTNDNGEYSFNNVPAGTYNIIAVKGNDATDENYRKMTALVEVKSNKTVDDIILPNERVNSVVQVGANTPAVMIGELDEVAKDEKVDDHGVTVTMTVQTKTSADAETAAIKEMAESNSDIDTVELEYLDITIEKKADNTTQSNISDTNHVIEIIVPFDFANRKNCRLFRYHGTNVDSFTELNARPAKAYFQDASFYADRENSRMYVYGNKFSTYAISYETASTVKVTFIKNDTTGDEARQTIALGTEKALDANTFTRSGYSFSKWNTEADGSGTDYSDGQSVTLYSDLVLYAQWKQNSSGGDETPARTSFTVSFDLGGHGTAIAPQTVEKNKTASKPADPEAEGFTFTGWYKEKDCRTKYDFTTPVTEDITLYAGWESGEPVIIETGSDWNLYEDASVHEFKIRGINVNGTVANSNAKSKTYYDAKISGSTITVKVTGDRKKAASNATLEFDLGNAGVATYVLPVSYVKPSFKLSSTTATIKSGTETVLKTTLLTKNADGNFVPYDMTNVNVSGTGLGTVTKAADGSIEIKTSAVASGKINIVKDTWDGANPVSLPYTVNGSKKDVLSVDLRGLKTVVVNSNAKGQVLSFDMMLNGAVPAEGVVKIVDKKNTRLATIGKDGKLIVAFNDGVKNGTYTITLQAGEAKTNVKVKVSDKVLDKAVTAKVQTKYDVVTRQGMVVIPVLKDVSGTIEAVSVAESGFFARLNAAGNIVIDYTGDKYNSKNLNIGTLTLSLKLNGIDEPVKLTLNNVKAKKTTPTVKAGTVTIPKDAETAEGKVIGTANIVSTYKVSSGIDKTIRPVKAEIVGTPRGVTAKVNENDMTEIDIYSISKKNISFKVKLTYAGGMTKTVTVKVKKK